MGLLASHPRNLPRFGVARVDCVGAPLILTRTRTRTRTLTPTLTLTPTRTPTPTLTLSEVEEFKKEEYGVWARLKCVGRVKLLEVRETEYQYLTLVTST